MLNHARRRAFVVPFVASVCLFGVSDTWAHPPVIYPHPQKSRGWPTQVIGLKDLTMPRSRVTKDL